MKLTQDGHDGQPRISVTSTDDDATIMLHLHEANGGTSTLDLTSHAAMLVQLGIADPADPDAATSDIGWISTDAAWRFHVDGRRIPLDDALTHLADGVRSIIVDSVHDRD